MQGAPDEDHTDQIHHELSPLQRVERTLEDLGLGLERGESDAALNQRVQDAHAALHSKEYLNQLSNPVLKQTITQIIEVNKALTARTSLSRIGSGPLYAYASRKVDLKSVQEQTQAHLSSLFTADQRYDSFSTVLKLTESTNDAKLVSFVALLYIINNKNASKPKVSVHLEQAVDEHLDTLAKCMPSLRLSFPNNEREFIEFWYELHEYRELRKDTCPLIVSLESNNWQGWVLERMADFSTSENQSQHLRDRAYQIYRRALTHSDAKEKANLKFALTSAVRLCVDLARETKSSFYRDQAIAAGLTHLRLFPDDGPEALAKITEDLAYIEIDRNASTPTDRALRGITKMNIPAHNLDIVIVSDDQCLSNSVFHICIFTAEQGGTEGLDVKVQAKLPTYIGAYDYVQLQNISSHAKIFQLRSGPGNYTAQIFVTLLLEGKPLQTVEYAIQIRETAADSLAIQADAFEVHGLAGEGADLTITAINMRETLVIHVHCDKLGIYQLELPRIRLENDPGIFIEREFARIREIYGPSTGWPALGKAAQNVQQILTGISTSFRHSLTNTGLLEILRDAIGKVQTISIATNDTSIPWELLPVAAYGGEQTLACLFQTSIYPTCSSMPATFEMRTAHVSALGAAGASHMNKNLQFVQDNEIISTRLHAIDVDVQEIALTRKALLDQWGLYTGGLWYIATHGNINAESSRLTLRTDDVDQLNEIYLSDLCQPDRVSLGSFIFLNACNTVSPELTMFESTSWPLKLIQLGASGFLGTRWPITEVSAQEFARVFFRELASGSSVAKCTQLARQALVAKFGSSDLSWMSYSLFCNPSLKAKTGPHLSL